MTIRLSFAIFSGDSGSGLPIIKTGTSLPLTDLAIDSTLINGSITRIMNFRDFVNTGIKIDSIKSAKNIDQFDIDSVIYIGSSIFWYYSKQGMCEAQSIYFDKLSNIQFGRFLLNKSTSIEDLKKMFPLNCKNTEPMKLYRNDGIYQTCSVSVKDKKGQLWDMRIIFFLKGDRLFRIDFWEPM